MHRIQEKSGKDYDWKGKSLHQPLTGEAPHLEAAVQVTSAEIILISSLSLAMKDSLVGASL